MEKAISWIKPQHNPLFSSIYKAFLYLLGRSEADK
jgi:hypothetical protein